MTNKAPRKYGTNFALYLYNTSLMREEGSIKTYL